MDLEVSVGERDGFVVLSVVGEVDVYTCPQLRETFAQIVSDGVDRDVVVDLSGVTFMDSSGIGVLVSARRRLPPGAQLRLVATQGKVRRLFALAGLTQVFPIFPLLAEATWPSAGREAAGAPGVGPGHP